jgi:hypothetical protein
MKQPMKRGEPISPARFKRWVDDFGSYRHQVTDLKIQSWLEQFQSEHKDVAARLLDIVDFIGFTQTSKLFRDILGAIPGWHVDSTRRQGKWRFVAYSGSAGESGDTMLHLFRLANNLDRKKYNELFISRSDLVRANLTAEDTVVFVDDFSGSGKTVCDGWKDSFQELLHTQPRTILILLGACRHAIRLIKEETDMMPVCGFTLNERDDIFHSACGYFTNDEKRIIFNYCEKANKGTPQGFGNCGLVLVFAHRCPNNTIPIFHETNGKWFGLFIRHD